MRSNNKQGKTIKTEGKRDTRERTKRIIKKQEEKYTNTRERNTRERPARSTNH